MVQTQQNAFEDDHDVVEALPVLEIMPGGVPRGVQVEQLAVKQPHNYKWKMILWNEPRVVVALLQLRRAQIGWFTRGLVRCLAAVGCRRWAAGLLLMARQRQLTGMDLSGAKLEVVALFLPGAQGHELSPDVTIRVTWPFWRRWWRRDRRPMLLNLELVKDLSVVEDTEQLWSYFSRYREQEGPRLRLRQELVVTYWPCPPGQPSSLVLCDDYNGMTLRVSVNRVGECSAAWIPAAARRTAFGAIGVLQFPDGQRPEDVANAARRCYDDPYLLHSNEGRRFVRTSVRDFPEVWSAFVEEVKKMANGQVMADGAVAQLDANPAKLINLVNACVESVDATAVPRVRTEMERSRKEGRKQGRNEGRNEGRQEAHVANLLEVLRERNIWLSSTQVAKLRSMGCEELPKVRIAVRAKDADDFARRAGL